jgi:hypothetical protein
MYYTLYTLLIIILKPLSIYIILYHIYNILLLKLKIIKNKKYLIYQLLNDFILLHFHQKKSPY